MHIRARDAHAPHILGVSHPYSDRLFRRSYPWLLEWCAATVPNEKMKHLGVLPARNHDENHREQHGNRYDDKKCCLA
jgi:hypothetical protein